MTTWKYQLFVISVGAQAGADVLGHQGLQDQLNDLGREGWELTAVRTRVTRKSSFSNSRTKSPLILLRWLKCCAGKIITCGEFLDDTEQITSPLLSLKSTKPIVLRNDRRYFYTRRSAWGRLRHFPWCHLVHRTARLSSKGKAGAPEI